MKRKRPGRLETSLGLSELTDASVTRALRRSGRLVAQELERFFICVSSGCGLGATG